MGTGFWWESLNDRGRLESTGMDWMIILKVYLKEIQYEATELSHLTWRGSLMACCEQC
jgi:hypothetical protein